MNAAAEPPGPRRSSSEDHQELLEYIYNRAGKVTAHKGQAHLRDFAEGGNGSVQK
jgi:hypothetical protein